MAERGSSPGRTQGFAGTWPPRTAVQAGGFAPSGFGAWSSFIERLRAWIRAEAGAGRLLPWVPVAFGTGIAFYFAADREPVASVTAVAATAFGVAAFLLRRQKIFPIAVMIAAMAAGFATATWKTARIAHGVLARPMYSVSLSGFVEARDIRERTDRFVLRVSQMESPRGKTTLERVRLSVRKGTAPAVGSFVELKARLQPPLAPLRPGSYDFGRDMYFAGIGASGFVTGAIKTVAPPMSGGLSLRYAAFMQGLRDAISARVNDAMFISGLGHVLSISGYHMAVVAGVVFFAVRALLALIPGLTVSFPIKKWSAAAALAAAGFYLLLSGAEVATQRSFFMTAVVLIAIMVDRRAVTFRTLAVAAMIVLAIAPEALVHPSFQMSFAATLGLVALVQIGMPRLFASPDNSATARMALWGGREIATLALASLVAGLATTPYAAFHFHRVTPYGVLANLAAMPVVSALVMPAGLLGLVAMPFGFDGFFWWLMGLGIDWMIVASAGIVLLGLLRTPLRWLGAAVLALAVVWALAVPQPDILISADGHNVGVRGKDGRLHLMRTAKDAFLLKEWLAADADPRLPTNSSLTEGVSCDEAGCVVQTASGAFVALALRPDALGDDCERAALVVTARRAPPACPSPVIDGERLRRQGAMALRRTTSGFAVDAIRPKGVDRPWSPAAAGDTEAEPTLASRPAAVPRAVDATPSEADLQAEE